MDLSRTIFAVIDTRSFSNLWYWIALAVMWSSASHWVLGVPWDLVIRAKRLGGEAVRDVETLAAVHTRRVLYILRVSGPLIFGIIACVLVFLATLGFGYGQQFCQAIFLLGLPMSLVGVTAIRTALRIEAGANSGDALYRCLRRQRIWVKVIGMISIFVTALWGMYQNLHLSVLGG